MDAQARYRSVDAWRWRGRSVDVSVRRCKCREVRGCRRRCIDATAAQRQPQLRKYNAEEVQIELKYISH